MDELRALVDLQQPHIVSIVESWLSGEISDNEIHLQGYQVLRLDRNRHGGGLLVFVHESLAPKVIMAGPSNLELLIFSVTNHANTCKHHVGLYYHPPSSSVENIECLHNCLQSLDPLYFSNFVLVGDFNIDFYKHSHFLYSRLFSIIHSFSLHQVVDSHTHISPTDSASLIDLALVSNLPQLQECSIVPPLANYDHSGLFVSLKWRSAKRPTTNNKRAIWKYAQADFTKACRLIEDTNWDALLGDDINDSLYNWQTKFMEIIGECIPKMVLPKRGNLPWMTTKLTRGMRKRNSLYKRARKSGNPFIYQKYKQVRNNVVQELRRAKKQYFRKLDPSNPKQFWKTVKLMTKSTSSIPVLERNNVTAIKNSDKATMLNQYFSECFNKAQPPLSSGDSFNNEGMNECPEDFLCTEEEVFDMLASLDVSKANGPDGISAKMLKGTAHSITPSLTKLFNISISTGIFPEAWKVSSVVPIPKANDRASPTNYRPISLLSVISKMLERHFYYLISSYLSENHPLANIQWGFQSGKSTISALLATTYNWFTQLEAGRDISSVFFDLRKAFDSVPHRQLIDKLQQLNVSPLILRWICSYLTARCQKVVIGGEDSETIPVISGVPQGSVLGPLLFLIYIDDVARVPLSEGTSLVLYADDLLLFRAIDGPEDFAILQRDINAVNNWVSNNYLQFNVSKCKFMHISRKRQFHHPIPDLLLDGQSLERVTSFKYLGILLTSDLKWSCHIETICSKARKILGLIYRRFCEYAEPSALLQLYMSLVRPHLEYGCHIWDPHLQKDKVMLENVQKFGLRICARQWDLGYNELLSNFHAPTLQDHRLYHKLCNMYKIVNNLISFPPSIFVPRHSSHHANTYVQPFAHSNAFLHSYVPSTVSSWNSLSSNITNQSTLSTFKSHLSTSLL